MPIVDEGAVTHLDRIALLRVAATVCRLRKTAGNGNFNFFDPFLVEFFLIAFLFVKLWNVMLFLTFYVIPVLILMCLP